MQFGRFSVEGLPVMGEAVSVAVDAVDMMGSNLPGPSRWRAIASCKSSVEQESSARKTWSLPCSSRETLNSLASPPVFASLIGPLPSLSG